MTNFEQLQETKRAVKELCIEQGAEGLEELIVESVNSVINKMMVKFPELKKEDPKEIGQLVKGLAFSFMEELAKVPTK